MECIQPCWRHYRAYILPLFTFAFKQTIFNQHEFSAHQLTKSPWHLRKKSKQLNGLNLITCSMIRWGSKCIYLKLAFAGSYCDCMDETGSKTLTIYGSMTNKWIHPWQLKILGRSFSFVVKQIVLLMCNKALAGQNMAFKSIWKTRTRLDLV